MLTRVGSPSTNGSDFAAIGAVHVKGFVVLCWTIAIGMSIVATAIASGVVYHALAYGEAGNILKQAEAGALIALVYVVSCWRSGGIPPDSSTAIDLWRKQFGHWNIAFSFLLIVAFASKGSDEYSRGAILLHYVAGFPALVAAQLGWNRLLVLGFRTGRIAARHIFVIGPASKIAQFRETARPADSGLVISTFELPESASATRERLNDPTFRLALEGAGEIVRNAQVHEIVLLLPWSDTEAIDVCVDAFRDSPASIYLGPERIVDRFPEIRISRIGRSACLNLVRPPLNAGEVAIKRAFDIVFATCALLLVSPVLLVVAALIKLETGGPVIFRQRRHGFNSKPFSILKFRSMTVAEDGDAVRQAQPGDERITRVGAFIRRWNFDELPQLFNVLKGDMSIVGPRPHALTHNHQFERVIARYAERHKLKPGITGWAQVNGFRGLTETNDKMQRRVEHDLFYVGHWSLWLDLYIIAMTVVSPKAFRNAV